MKKIIIILFLILFLSSSRVFAQAQLRTDSNTVTTTVGNPPSQATSPSDCPIPNGIVTCGSKYTPVSDCGHCGVGYPQYAFAYCNYTGINYAMDVAYLGGGSSNDLQPIYLPKINGDTIKWTWRTEEQGATESIQKYTGVDQQTGDQYYIQFHHTQLGSGNPGDHLSGDVGARICGNGCGEGHVHIEFGKGSAFGQGPQDATQYFCKKP